MLPHAGHRMRSRYAHPATPPFSATGQGRKAGVIRQTCRSTQTRLSAITAEHRLTSPQTPDMRTYLHTLALIRVRAAAAGVQDTPDTAKHVDLCSTARRNPHGKRFPVLFITSSYPRLCISPHRRCCLRWQQSMPEDVANPGRSCPRAGGNLRAATLVCLPCHHPCAAHWASHGRHSGVPSYTAQPFRSTQRGAPHGRHVSSRWNFEMFFVGDTYN